MYSCIYDEYKGFILYLYLQVTTDFVLTIIGTTCHVLVADFSSVEAPFVPSDTRTFVRNLIFLPGLSFATYFKSSMPESECPPTFEIILKREVHVERHVSESAPLRRKAR